MSVRIAAFVGVACFILSAPPAAPQVIAPAAPTKYTSQAQQARTLIHEYLIEDSLPGISVAVGVDGQIVWSEGFGFANVEHRVPVVPTTRFRIGSTSKALTAGAFGLLVEQEKLDLDATIQRYVPSFPKKRWPITVRELASHQAGIRAYTKLSQPEPRPGPFANLQGFVQTKHYNSVEDALELFQDDPLLFEPGTRFHYTSFGSNLLSAVIQGAAGEDFLSYMKAHVFDPLGMRYTTADEAAILIDQRAGFYSRAPMET